MHQTSNIIVLVCLCLIKFTDARVCAPADPLVRPACPGSWRYMTEADCDGLSAECCWNATVDINYPFCYYIPKDVGYDSRIALNKPTFHKTTGWGGASSRAVDGCSYTDFSKGCCSHTLGKDPDPWWSVDLTRIYTVVSVTITTRSSSSIVEKFKLLGSNTSHDPAAATDIVECADHPGRLPFDKATRILCTTPITVRYLIIQKTNSANTVLVLCEVQVEAGYTAGRFNAALGKLARQTGNLVHNHQGKTYDTRALKAVDGCGLTGVDDRCTCHTGDTGPNPWWSVDLGKQYMVYSVTIKNRNAHNDNLKDFTIYTSNNTFNTTFGDRSVCGTHGPLIPYHSYQNIPCNNPIMARYIIITKSTPVFAMVQFLVEAECATGKYGMSCQRDCHNCRDGAVCDAINGHCPGGICASGYQGPKCDKLCSGTFGQNCAFNCSENCDTRVPYICDPISGSCPGGMCHDGFMRPNCLACQDGKYGTKCLYNCHRCRNNQVCDKVSGWCPGGLCARGYQGQKCDQSCNRTFGENCLRKCSSHCSVSELNICDQVSGECPQGLCHDGYLGPECIKPCLDNTYGSNCTNRCSGNCLNGAVCDKVTGACPDDACKPGYTGFGCFQKCPVGTYGASCLYLCSRTCKQNLMCDFIDGTCPSGCIAGYKGDTCDQLTEKQADDQNVVVIVLPVCFIVLVIVVLVAVYFILKLRHKTPNNASNNDSRKDQSSDRQTAESKVGSRNDQQNEGYYNIGQQMKETDIDKTTYEVPDEYKEQSTTYEQLNI